MQPLWPGFAYKTHQTTAIEWMLERESDRGGLLCDEMGLGKTMEILGTMKNSTKKETLLLCPKAVIAQWRDAATKSKFNVFEVGVTGWKMGAYHSGQPFLYLTNYDKIAGHPSLFSGRNWDRIVLDEAHRVRNIKGALWKAIYKMKYKTMWCVTATPLVNGLKDIHALFTLLGHHRNELVNYAYLTDTMSKECIHRSMDEMRPILPELPAPPSITKIALDFETSEEAEFYQGIQGKIMKRWKALEKDQSTEGFVMIMRLRQLSLHPQIYINARKREWAGYDREDWNGESTKFVALKKKLQTSAPARWIIFNQFHEEMNILADYLEPYASLIQQYHGGMNDSEKDDVIKGSYAPLEDKHQILLVQLHSGGVGLNLQHFTKIIFLSPWWTAALMDQAIGRAVRIGQKETVEVILYVLKEEDTLNIDELMLGKVNEKRHMLKMLFIHASRGIGKPLPGENEENPEDPI